MRRQRGFTLLELVVVIAVTSMLAIILLNRLLYYQEVAEKTAMEMTVMNMRSGLRLRIADLMTQDRMREAVQLLQENPVTWLESPPPNYMGKVSGQKSAEMIPGQWYFDPGQQELVYRVQHDRFFKSGTDEESTIRFHVTAVQYPRQGGKAEGITLAPVTPYHWF